MELTSQELAELYAQIENKSDKEITNLINDESEKLDGFLIGGGWLKRVFGGGADKNQAATPLIEICKKCAIEFSADLKAILKNNPKSTNYALNVIQLLAPAIAQQYSGIPAMAIVGSITLLCRQGIENFIK